MSEERAVEKNATLWIILVSATLTVMAGAIIGPVLNLMRDGVGVGPALAGLIITTHGLFIALFSPIMGVAIDRLGPKKVFVVGLIVYGFAGGSGLVINDFLALLVSRAFLGIAVAAFYNAITVLIYNLYEGNARNNVMGWRGSTNSLSALIWPLIGGALGGLSWHLPFSIYLLGIPLGLLALITVPRSAIGKIEEIDVSLVEMLKEKPVFLIIYGLMFLTNVMLYAIVVYLPQLLEIYEVTEPIFISVFLAAAALTAASVAFFYAKIRSRISYRKIIVLTFLSWSAGFTMIFQFSYLPLIWIGAAIYGVGQGLMLPTVMVWLGDITPPSYRGRMSSYLGTFGFVGQFVSPILFAPFIDYGLSTVFLVAALFSISVLVLSILLVRKK